ncbi:uncharacterized protein LOC126265032 [Aethina tumida]|uniref:uncharacterized protein LOC126265032 n=1 Tax=Aethina tumida TaxID=116153 RepID=UPI0021474149|nr:uncharacterized protein LOC126265032 [Aethina tumida]
MIQEREDYVPTIMLLAMHVSHLTILYWNADLIRSESMQLAQHAYLYSDWHKGNTRFKFLIQIFILRTQGPLSLAIGPFGEMSNLAFISVLKAAFSYLTFFRNVYKVD